MTRCPLPPLPSFSPPKGPLQPRVHRPVHSLLCALVLSGGYGANLPLEQTSPLPPRLTPASGSFTLANSTHLLPARPLPSSLKSAIAPRGILGLTSACTPTLNYVNDPLTLREYLETIILSSVSPGPPSLLTPSPLSAIRLEHFYSAA